jgi:hypothetical protein
LLDNGLLKHVSRQRTRLEKSKRCPETETRFVATDETQNNRGTATHGDFYEGRVTVIKGSVETGSNTSTVTLRVVGGDEKGSLKFETAKYGRESQGIRTRGRLRWQGPAAIANGRPVLSSERAPHVNKLVTV